LFEVHVTNSALTKTALTKTALTKTALTKTALTKSAFAIAALVLALGATSVRAQGYDPRYPVCIHVFGELEGERMDCVFTSIAQCQLAASGRPAMCLINPYFVPPTHPRRR
jgi:hypothetical protein